MAKQYADFSFVFSGKLLSRFLQSFCVLLNCSMPVSLSSRRSKLYILTFLREEKQSKLPKKAGYKS